MKYSIIVTLALSLIGCVNTQQLTEGKEIKLQETGAYKELQFTDVFTPLETVCLDTKDVCQLKSITKVEVYDNCYYILGGTTKSAVFVFDKDGHFIRKIGTQGHGKGEYLNAHDFTIDKENKRIAILSAPSKVYFYSLQGDFLNKKELGKILVWNITSTSTGFIASTNHLTYTSGDNAYLLYFFNKDFDATKKEVPVLPYQIYMPSFGLPVFQRNDGKDYYVDIYNNKIIDLLGSNENKMDYMISLPNPMPTENFKEWKVFSENQRKYDWIQNICLLGDDAVFVYKQGFYINVESVSLSGKVIVHGCYGGNFPKMFSDGKGNAILCISAYSYLKNKMEDLLPGLKGKVKASDNYILVKCKLKKDN